MHFFPPPYFLPNLKHVFVLWSTCSESPALLCSAQVNTLPTPSSCSSLVIRDQGTVTSILLRFIRLVTFLSPQLKMGSSSSLRQFVSLGRWKGSLGVRRLGSSRVPLGKSLHSSQPHFLIWDRRNGTASLIGTRTQIVDLCEKCPVNHHPAGTLPGKMSFESGRCGFLPVGHCQVM